MYIWSEFVCILSSNGVHASPIDIALSQALHNMCCNNMQSMLFCEGYYHVGDASSADWRGKYNQMKNREASVHHIARTSKITMTFWKTTEQQQVRVFVSTPIVVLFVTEMSMRVGIAVELECQWN